MGEEGEEEGRRGSHADFSCSINTKVSAVRILLDRDRGKKNQKQRKRLSFLLLQAGRYRLVPHLL